MHKAQALFAGGVLPGALQQQIDIQRAPINPLGLSRAQHLDGLAVDQQLLALQLHLPGEAPVGRIKAGQVLDTLAVRQIIQRHHLNVRPRRLVQRTQHTTTDPAVAVQGDAVGRTARCRGHSGLFELWSSNALIPGWRL